MALNESMAEALRLTRSGNLMEATALLQAALGSGGYPPSPKATGDVITLVPKRIMLRGLGSGEPGTAAKPAARAREPGDAARLDEHIYRVSQGSLTYWLYRPADVAANAPLVVMLHGCTKSSQDFARGTGMNLLADELGFLVAYPQQNPAANPQKCWNWFRPGDQQRDRGEPAQLAGITRQIVAEHAVDPDRVYVAGLSAGGAAAAIMAAQYPDLYAAVGVHSGLACGAARDLPSALAAMQRGGGTARPIGACQPFVPVITFHGSRDATVNEVNSRQIVAAASAASTTALEVQVEKGCTKSGRIYSRAQHLDGEGAALIEQWTIEGLGHAWSGGSVSGSYTDPSGPDASRAMIEFFLKKRRT